ncbi:hypothetical protein RB201_18000 [Streptomyces sp. S1A(2023)]
MSTLTPPKPDAATGPAPARATLRGPVRVVLRMHRKALWAGAALLVLGIGIVVALRRLDGLLEGVVRRRRHHPVWG